MTELQLIPVVEVGLDSLTAGMPGTGQTHDALLFSAALQASLGGAKGQEAGASAGNAEKGPLTEQELELLQDAVAEGSELPEFAEGPGLKKRTESSELPRAIRKDAQFQVGSVVQTVATKEAPSHRAHQATTTPLNQEVLPQADDASAQNRNYEPVRNLTIDVREEDARTLQNLRTPIDLHLRFNAGSRNAKGPHIQSRPTPVWHTPESVAALTQAGDVEIIRRPASHIIPEVRTLEAYHQLDLNTDVSKKRSLNKASHTVSMDKTSMAVTEAPSPSASEMSTQHVKPLKIKASAGPSTRHSNTTDSSPGEMMRIPYQQLNLSRFPDTGSAMNEMELLSNSSLEGPARFVIEEINGNVPIQRIRIQLEPQHLGRVTIFLRHSRGGIHARVVAERAEALPMVESQMEIMRAALTARGIEFTSFSLTANTTSRSSGMKPTAKTADKKAPKQTEATTISAESELLEASTRKAQVQ